MTLTEQEKHEAFEWLRLEGLGGNTHAQVLAYELVRLTCRCRQCALDRGENIWGQMILCTACGNKRCPHASNHRNDCTGSNDPGQKGSIYA